MSAMDKQGEWSSRLILDCCNDPSICFLTTCCPCITFGRMAEILDEGATTCSQAGYLYYCLGGCAWIYASSYRSKLRNRYALKEDPCADCVVHCFCHTCALAQEYRELSNRGIDPSIGWSANVQKGNPVGLKVPPTAMGMSR